MSFGNQQQEESNFSNSHDVSIIEESDDVYENYNDNEYDYLDENMEDDYLDENMEDVHIDIMRTIDACLKRELLRGYFTADKKLNKTVRQNILDYMIKSGISNTKIQLDYQADANTTISYYMEIQIIPTHNFNRLTRDIVCKYFESNIWYNSINKLFALINEINNIDDDKKINLFSELSYTICKIITHHINWSLKCKIFLDDSFSSQQNENDEEINNTIVSDDTDEIILELPSDKFDLITGLERKPRQKRKVRTYDKANEPNKRFCSKFSEGKNLTLRSISDVFPEEIPVLTKFMKKTEIDNEYEALISKTFTFGSNHLNQIFNSQDDSSFVPLKSQDTINQKHPLFDMFAQLYMTQFYEDLKKKHKTEDSTTPKDKKFSQTERQELQDEVYDELISKTPQSQNTNSKKPKSTIVTLSNQGNPSDKRKARLSVSNRSIKTTQYKKILKEHFIRKKDQIIQYYDHIGTINYDDNIQLIKDLIYEALINLSEYKLQKKNVTLIYKKK